MVNRKQIRKITRMGGKAAVGIGKVGQAAGVRGASRVVAAGRIARQGSRGKVATKSIQRLAR